MSTTSHRLASGDLVQDWSNAGLITANDDWASMPGIVGYLGDINAASPTNVDPRTLTSATLGAVDVVANQTAPNTLTNGGVAEFAIANPTIALNGSGTADAPCLVLYLDASGRQNVRLTFNARDIDASADDASQQIAVQYRLGNSATWTNVAYDADVTTVNSATETTPFDVLLPPEVNGHADLQIRIVTTNAGGNDEWVGIDDIRVGSSGTEGQTAGFSANSISVSHDEGSDGVTPYTFTIERSGGTEGDVSFSGTFVSASTDAADYSSGKPIAFSGTIPAGATSATVTVNIAGDVLSEADETFSLTLNTVSNSAAVTTTIGTVAATGTIVNDDVAITKISAIQGAGASSGMVGQTVTIDAIVVGDFQNGDGDNARNLNGFYLQEEAFDSDGNALTSEGIFVYTGSTDVHVGDRVRVTGKVSEYYGLTEVTATSISVVEAGAVADVHTMAAAIDLPSVGTTLSQNGDYQPDLEAYEGMLVTIPETLTITEQYNLDRFNEMKLVAGDRPETFTQTNDPDATAYQEYLQEQGARTITYDDGLNVQNAPISNVGGLDPNDDPPTTPSYATESAPRMGDTVTGLTGVLDYQWAGEATSGATWRIRSIENDDNTFESANPRTETPDDVGGRLKVASFNVLNYFTTLDNGGSTAIGQEPRGAENAAEFARQTEKLVNAIVAMDADVLSLVELENDFAVGSSGNAIAYLVAQLNAALGAGTYAWVNPGQQFVGGDAIAVGFIYKTATVAITDGTTVEILNDADLPALGLDELPAESTVGAVFDGANTSRNAVAVSFTEIATGESFTAIANHLKSKSGTGTGADADEGDGQGNWQNQRELASAALTKWAASDPTGSGDSDVLLLGDFNAYAKEDAIKIIENAGYDNLGAGDGEYSYVFDGQTGTLDDIFANESMVGQVTGTTHWHINSDEADALDYNTNYGRDQTIYDGDTPARTSDHDPLIIGLDLDSTPEPEVAYTLQILHASDFEAGLKAVDSAGNFAAIVDYLEETQQNSITLSSGDNFIPSPFFSAGSDASLKEVYETTLENYYNLAPGTLNIAPGFGTADVSMLNIIGVEASAIGNHEFDAGTKAFADIIKQTAGYPGAQFPYLAANLDFSADANLASVYTSTIQGNDAYAGFPPAAGIGKKIAPATILEEGGEKIGVVGCTTQIVESISSTGGVDVIGDDADDMAALAAIIQPTIDALIAQGINKIILVSHLQQLAFEKALAPLLHGLDVIVAGGSHTLLADAEDTLSPGDVAADTYPLVTTNADGKTTLIVNTSGEYSYVGRLVVDFDENGDVIAENLDANVSGAYATTDEVVDDLYEGNTTVDVDADGDVDAADADPFAEGSRGDLVDDIAQAVGSIIDTQDGNTFGKTDVYLEGRRGEARTEETNLGDLSADANLWYAQKVDATVLVSIKNGGGIRDSIGSVYAIGDDAVESPPLANDEVGKEAGEVSQLDIANSLRFNNALSLVTVTAAQLLLVLEHAVAATTATATPGQFAQIGGIAFSFDKDLPAGNRVQSAAILSEDGEPVLALVKDSELVVDPAMAIRVVTLSFLLTGGDSYPFASFIAADPEFADVVSLDANLVPDAGQVADFAAEGTEQDAFAEYMAANYSEDAFGVADTTRAEDERIQNLDYREDTVLDGLSESEPTDGDDVLVGTPFADALSGLDGDDEISGLAGDDIIDGGEGDDTVYGGTGDDVIAGGVGDNTLFGDAGDDVFVASEGDDVVDGGEGVDTVDYSADTAGVTADLALGEAFGDDSGYDVVTGVENLTGGAGDDHLIGDAGANVLIGNAGDDVLMGGGGDDRLVGDAGADDLIGGEGRDTVVAGAGDDIEGGAGDDLILVSVDDGAPAAIDGGEDDDTVRLTGAGTGALGTTTGIETLDVVGGSWTVVDSANFDGIAIGAGAAVTSGLTRNGADTTVIAATGMLNGKLTVSNTESSTALDNAGTISTASSQAVSVNTAGAATVTLVNRAGATIEGKDTGSAGVLYVAGSGGAAVVLNNDGLIEGNARVVQANDFKGASFTINNGATGIIRTTSTDEEVLRGNLVVNNAGQIVGGTGTSAEAIDAQSYALIFNNLDGGSITAGKHAITGKAGATIVNGVGAVMIGGNGSAVNMDNDATEAERVTVTNYGLMQGKSANTTDSDGDAIDVDGLLTLDNHGTIEGLGHNGAHNGEANVSEGIAAGGAAIHNYANGKIYGYGRAIQIDDSGNGAAFGSSTIVNEGLIEGAGHRPTGVTEEEAAALDPVGSEAINIVGTGADSLTNSGIIIGGVKMGGGNDVLVNTGTMTAIGGSAIDMGDGDDIVTLSGGSVVTGAILLGAGNDTFTGADAAETVDGGDGVDTLDGGAGNDVLAGGTGDDALAGGAGDDVLQGGFGNDTANGGAGFDTLDLSDATGAITLDMVAGKVSGAGIGTDTFTGIEAFRFGAGNDVVTGGNGDEIFDGGAGNDTLKGGAGDDQLAGGAGADTVDGGSGDDAVAGGAGNDTLKGGSGDDLVDGGDGVDDIDAGSGDDIVTAGVGNDLVVGGSGNDVITGGAGNDTLTGGSGHDVFVFAAGFGQDRIKDFALAGSSSDVIEFSSDLFDDFADVMANAAQVGCDVLISVDADTTLTLANIKLGALATDDFRFA